MSTYEDQVEKEIARLRAENEAWAKRFDVLLASLAMIGEAVKKAMGDEEKK